MIELLRRLYQRTIELSGHRRAPLWLSLISTTEAIFFPLMPDVVLAPMVAARPGRWLAWASLCTACSVLGGVLAWLLGHYGYELLQPWFQQLPGWEANFHTAELWFDRWGIWIIAVVGFTPVPYKVFTIAAGVLSMSLPLFILASALGRGLRFFLVAALVRFVGARALASLHSNIAVLGWTSLLLLVIVLWLLH